MVVVEEKSANHGVGNGVVDCRGGGRSVREAAGRGAGSFYIQGVLVSWRGKQPVRRRLPQLRRRACSEGQCRRNAVVQWCSGVVEATMDMHWCSYVVVQWCRRALVQWCGRFVLEV